MTKSTTKPTPALAREMRNDAKVPFCKMSKRAREYMKAHAKQVIWWRRELGWRRDVPLPCDWYANAYRLILPRTPPPQIRITNTTWILVTPKGITAHGDGAVVDVPWKAIERARRMRGKVRA